MIDSNNRLLSTLVGMQLLTLGILVVMLFNPHSQSSDTIVDPTGYGNSPTRKHSFASPTHSESGTVELKTALREIIRDELAALSSSGATGATDDFVSQPDVVLTESALQEQETAATVSAAIIQQATSAGIWTRADTEALLPHIAKISEQQRLALTDQLYSSINRQELAMEDFPPL